MPASQSNARSHAVGVLAAVVGALHGPDNGRGVIEIRVVAVGKLEWPAATGQIRPVDLPVTRRIQQLFALQPIERRLSADGRRRTAGLLAWPAPPAPCPKPARRRVGNRRKLPSMTNSFSSARLAVTRRGSSCRITEQHHRLQGIDHGGEDCAEAIFAVQALQEPVLRALGGGGAHRSRNQEIRHPEDTIDE